MKAQDRLPKSNDSRASQEHLGKSGASFPAVASQQQAPVLQMNNPKKSILSPQDDQLRSKIVPDLSIAMVDEMTQAKSKEEREEVLQKLFWYLYHMGAVDSPRTIILYVDGNSKDGHMANTWLSGENDNDPLQITFYKPSFERGPAILYSIFRHELIHVSQMLKVPRSEEKGGAEATDKFMYMNINDKEVGSDVDKSIQVPLREIETHVWEIHHADETGVDQDKDYMKETFRFLIDYTTLLLKGVGKASKKQAMYWKAYIINAIRLLESFGDDTIVKLVKELIIALEKQEKKKETKRDGKNKKRKKEDEVEVQEEEEITEIDLEDQIDAETVNTGKQVENKKWIFQAYNSCVYREKIDIFGLQTLKQMIETNMNAVPKTWQIFYVNCIKQIDFVIGNNKEEEKEVHID